MDNPIRRLDFRNIFREAFEHFRFGAGNGLLFLRISNVAMDKKASSKSTSKGSYWKLQLWSLIWRSPENKKRRKGDEPNLEFPSFSGDPCVQLQGWTSMMTKKHKKNDVLPKFLRCRTILPTKTLGPNQKRRRFEGHLAFPNYSLKHTYRTYRTVPVVMELLTHFLAQTK